MARYSAALVRRVSVALKAYSDQGSESRQETMAPSLLPGVSINERQAPDDGRIVGAEMGIRIGGLLPVLLGFLSLLPPCYPFHGSVVASSKDDAKKLYVVYMGEKQDEDPDVVASLHRDTLSSVLASREEALGSIVYSYKHGFSGFAAMLTASQAKELSELRGVQSVKLSQTVRLSTTRSWDFLGLASESSSELLGKAKMGDGMIIGVIDSGIWPESKSFDDSGYGAVPARWKGICQTGEEFNVTHCSRKIIGARWYAAGIPEPSLKEDYLSARDLDGHGTHVASTAAGSHVQNASVGGLAAGWARGGAPRARLAIYKIIWGRAGYAVDASLFAAIDDAIHDGVDVLSLSLTLFEDSWGLPSLHAVLRGITVVYAAGNSGPYPQTVSNTSPWVLTVAASTIDRDFPTAITLGNNLTLLGQGIYYGNPDLNGVFREIAYGSSCDEEALNVTDYGGKVILCNSRTVVPEKIRATGALGLIFPLHTTNLLLKCDAFPCIVVDLVIFQQILDYLLTSKNSPKVKLAPTRLEEGKTVLAPRVAAFSSRGPSNMFPGILKPDIAAPGVNILAAVKDSYQFFAGTSMAAPHVSGVVALLKALHPTWSPAAIKSAIMTTASVVDEYGMPIVAEGIPRKLADPFDYGGGHINPEKAADPGLVYDMNLTDFEEFKCSIAVFADCQTPPRPVYELNLPSISVPDLKTKVTVPRTVTNVGSTRSTYHATVESPPGVDVEVHPSKLVFDERAKSHNFTVLLTSLRRVQGVYTFGSLTWRDETHAVRIPIAVRTVIRDFYADVA